MSQYIAGTVEVVNGDATVTGTSTLWSANVSAGDVFTIQGSSVPYIVGSVTDNTHLELTAVYAGTSDSGLDYAITTSFTPTLGIPYMEQQDLDTATIFKRAMLQIEALLTGNAQTGGLDIGGNTTIAGTLGVSDSVTVTGGDLVIGTTGYGISNDTTRVLAIASGSNPAITLGSGSGAVTIPSLAGSGTRAVVVDSNGVMSAP